MTLEIRIIKALEDETVVDVEPLERELLRAPDRDRILDSLSRHRSPLVRGWTSGTARKLADDRFLPLLHRLARDHDADVRNIAFQDIADGWPSEVAGLLPAVRRELRGDNAIQALWTIADSRDEASRTAVEALVADVQRLPYQRNLAGIVLLMLDGDLNAILQRISNHDHDSMHWLVRAAMELDAEAPVATITDFLTRAPDSSCRHYCQMALRPTVDRVTFPHAD